MKKVDHVQVIDMLIDTFDEALGRKPGMSSISSTRR